MTSAGTQATLIKVCGITRPVDAERALACGADWLGLNFWPRSPRAIDAVQARAVVAAARAVRPGAVLVGVFVNASAVEVQERLAELGLDFAQLHGDESPEFCARFGERAIKAFRLASHADVARIADYQGQTVLVDSPSAAYGGSGRSFDWSLARAACALGRRLLLAGGLGPDNVADAIAAVAPFAVDVASGVESEPGIKDEEKLRRFVIAVRGAVRGTGGRR
jgi:phosphoribosylanthranilate isomerase